MSTNLNSLAINDAAAQTSGVVWDRLHSEREDICEALLKDCARGDEGRAGAPRISSEQAMRTANWHRELLQARLRKTDDALDRVMSGTYGNCSHCGKWIEDPKLEFDPAIAFCIECWQRMQTKN